MLSFYNCKDAWSACASRELVLKARSAGGKPFGLNCVAYYKYWSQETLLVTSLAICAYANLLIY